MTGISTCPPALAEDHGGRYINHHRSYVVLAQPGAELCWWLALFKHDQTFSEGNIPRYTVNDHKDILDKYGSDKLGDTTLRQLYESARHTVLVPIEEFTLDKWFLGRVVLLGDSCHKVHPIIGQGANQAIESAAYLADLLHDLVTTAGGDTPKTSVNESIHAALSQYQNTRHPRTVSVMNAGRFGQCVDSLDTRWFRLFAFHVAAKTPIQAGFLPSLANMVLPAVSIRGLPQPDHEGHVAYEDQLRIQPSPRSNRASLSFASVVVLAFPLSLYVTYHSSAGVYAEEPTSLYSAAQQIAINSLWVIESYRLNSGLSLVMR